VTTLGVVGPPVAGVREVDVDGCLTLYQRAGDQVLILNQTASDVWRLADGSLDEAEMVRLLARAYGVDPSTITGEVHAAIERFVEDGFLDLRVH
jgi:hypothetical protein